MNYSTVDVSLCPSGALNDSPNSHRYLGEAGFKAHTQAPHFAAWEEFAATDPFTEPPVVKFFTLQKPS